MEAKLRSYLVNWNFMRLLRLAMGIYVAVQAVMTQSWSFGLIAVLFLGQAITNTGCCGAGACGVPMTKSQQNKEIEFEEIKK